MLQVRCARPEDVETFQLHPTQGGDVVFLDMLRQVPPDFLGVYCRSILADDDVLEIMGVTPLAPGVGEAWQFLGVHAFDHRVALARIQQRWIDEAFDVLHLYRLQASNAVENQAGLRYLTRCGFVCEGRMRSYRGPGRDYYLLSKVRGA